MRQNFDGVIISQSESTPLIYQQILSSKISIGNVQTAANNKRLVIWKFTSLTVLALFISLLFYTPSVYLRSSLPNVETCLNRDSLQTTASKVIPPLLSQLSMDVRLTIENLKDAQSIFNYAYFPLSTNHSLLNYSTWIYDKKDPGSFPPIRQFVLTNDPMEVLLYYLTNIFRTVGDISDSLSYPYPNKTHNLELLLSGLESDWYDMMSRPLTENCTWTQYIKYPGPYGREWKDGTINTWAMESSFSSSDLDSALYLEPNNRLIDNQIWGNAQPIQFSSTMDAIASLIYFQSQETIKRYEDLLALDRTGNGDWANADILTNLEDIDTYHKVRKNLRTLGMTIETFPEVIEAFYYKVPKNVIEFMNVHFRTSISPHIEMSYGDIFGFGGSIYHVQPYAFTLSNSTLTQTPLYLLGNMLFVKSPPFDHKFFGLPKDDYNAIRAVLLVKGMRLGKLNIYQGTLGCPGSHVSFQNLMSRSDSNPFNPLVDDWVKPQYEYDSIVGTVCEMEDYMGDVHDLLVKIEEDSTIVNENFIQYTVSVAQGLQAFLEDIDVYRTLNQLDLGLC
jgi:hypothetical protein